MAKDWIKGAIKRPGAFTKKAKDAGMSVSKYANKVLKKGSKAAARRTSFCARSAGQMKKFPKAAKNPNSRLRQARKRWKC